LKVGRNDLCPCGSGKKYKNCCLNKPKGYTITNNKTGQQFVLGENATFFGAAFHRGNLQEVAKNKEKYKSYIYADLPVLLPLENQIYNILLDDGKYSFVHRTSSRGDEIYSNFDSSKLPYFSTLEIYSNSAIVDNLEAMAPRNEGYEIILKVLRRILELLPEEIDIGFSKTDEPDCGYTVFTQGKENKYGENVVLISEVPFSKTIQFHKPDIRRAVDQNKLRAQLTQNIEVDNFIRGKLYTYKDRGFRDKLFHTIHDFMYYCRQHSRVLSELYEELIRDLYLVVIKAIFHSAEGEAYNNRGKTDIKVVNPENRYEFCIMEFKWWNGSTSFKEAFRQLTETHATGQEKMYFLVILCKNKNINLVCSKFENLLDQEPQYEKGSFSKVDLITSNEQIFKSFIVNRRNEKLPLQIFVIDLYCNE
jgi:hypothetical protein